MPEVSPLHSGCGQRRFSSLRRISNPDNRPSREKHQRKGNLYADQVTTSMQKAIVETTEEEISEAYNAEHNISPKTVSKNIADVMEGSFARIC